MRCRSFRNGGWRSPRESCGVDLEGEGSLALTCYYDSTGYQRGKEWTETEVVDKGRASVLSRDGCN